MANRNDNSAVTAAGDSGSALRDARAAARRAAQKAESMADEDRDDRDEKESSRPASGAARAPRTGGFFDIYRPQQGRSVRMGTAGVAGLLLVWGAAFFYNHLPTPDFSAALRYGLPTLILVAGGLAAYHFLARDARVIDFMIATEGEMKKVHWSSRKEVIGSTKVVIFVLVFLSVAMFVIDFLLLVFFSEIGVLRIGQDAISALMGGS